MNRKKTLKYYLIAAILLSTLLNLWKAQYGFCSTDESFFISLAHRFYLGDAPVVDEWHPTQFAGLLITPLFWLYMKINGSTEGVFLFYRIVYVIMILAGSIFLAWRTREYGWGCFAAVLLFATYTKAQLPVTDYNSIGLSAVMTASVLLCFQQRSFQMYLAGIFYAASVLCTPHMAFLFFAVTGWMLVHRKLKDPENSALWKKWYAFLLGCLTLAAIIIGFMLSRASLPAILANFKYLFISDPSHKAAGFGPLVQTLALFKMVWLTSTLSTVVIPVYAAMILFMLFDKNREKHSHWYFIGAIVCSALLIPAYIKRPTYDYSMIALTPIGLTILLLQPEIDNRLKKFWLCGIGYLFMINLSSDTVISAASSASTVCGIASFLLMTKYLQQHLAVQWEKTARVLVTILSLFMLSEQIYSKSTVIYRDGKPLSLHERISAGPAKGLVTDTKKASDYNQMMKNLDQMNLQEGQNVLLFTDQAWMYLYLENHPYANYSAWFKPFREHYVDMLEQYYQQNSDKIPEAVYIPKGPIASNFDVNQFAAEYHLQIKTTEQGEYLTKAS